MDTPLSVPVSSREICRRNVKNMGRKSHDYRPNFLPFSFVCLANFHANRALTLLVFTAKLSALFKLALVLMQGMRTCFNLVFIMIFRVVFSFVVDLVFYLVTKSLSIRVVHETGGIGVAPTPPWRKSREKKMKKEPSGCLRLWSASSYNICPLT